MIAEIPKELAKLIKSQQYIFDSFIIAKELIENSLDANSNNIKIIIEKSRVIVEDNGDGINEDILENIFLFTVGGQFELELKR